MAYSYYALLLLWLTLTMAVRYARVIFTRLEFEWLRPHPPLHLLDPALLWLPTGEDNTGLNDRHWVANRRDAEGLFRRWDALVAPPPHDIYHRIFFGGGDGKVHPGVMCVMCNVHTARCTRHTYCGYTHSAYTHYGYTHSNYTYCGCTHSGYTYTSYSGSTYYGKVRPAFMSSETFMKLHVQFHQVHVELHPQHST